MLIKKITSAILAVAMVAAMSTTVFAEETPADKEAKQLKSDFLIISEVSEDYADEWVEENKKWYYDFNERLGNYMDNVPEDQYFQKYSELLPLDTKRSGSSYFTQPPVYAFRGGYMTYSMDPKFIHRTLIGSMLSFRELKDTFPQIASGIYEASLYDQMVCHGGFGFF